MNRLRINDHRSELEAQALIAWQKYKSAVVMAGTSEQRRHACTVAIEAEEKLARYDRKFKRSNIK